MKTNFSSSVSSYDENSQEQYQTGLHLIKWLSDFLKNNPKNYLKKIKILDLGCGTGRVTKKISEEVKKDFSITAIDDSLEMITYAKKKYSDETVNFIRGNIETELTTHQKIQQERPYDIFFSNATLHWLNDLDLFFNHLKKISHLKNNLESDLKSHFFFSIYTDGTFKEFNSFLKNKGIDYSVTIPYFSVEKLIEKMKKYFRIQQYKVFNYQNEYLNFKDFQKKQHLVGSFKSFDSKQNFSEMKKAIILLKENFDKPFFLTHEILCLEMSLR